MEDVFQHRLHAVNSGDMQASSTDYADDVQYLTAQGALMGKAGVAAFFTQAFSLLPPVRKGKSDVAVG